MTQNIEITTAAEQDGRVRVEIRDGGHIMVGNLATDKAKEFLADLEAAQGQPGAPGTLSAAPRTPSRAA